MRMNSSIKEINCRRSRVQNIVRSNINNTNWTYRRKEMESSTSTVKDKRAK
jgi:hypothetical protein